MTPVAAVAYVAPATAALLAIPWAALEAPTLLTPAARAPLRPDWLIMACSAALAGATMLAVRSSSPAGPSCFTKQHFSQAVLKIRKLKQHGHAPVRSM